MTTRTLRAAALGFGLPFVLALPLADGTIAIADRALLVGSYQAAAFSSGVVFPPGVCSTSVSVTQDLRSVSASDHRCTLEVTEATRTVTFVC